MKPAIIISIILVFGIGLGLSLTVSAEAEKIPSWIKNIALWWGQDQISDDDFLDAMQFLIKEGILTIPEEPTQIDSPSLEIDAGPSDDMVESDAHTSQNCSGSAKCELETVTRIVDGDTIYTTSYKIRLSLTNTPERDESGFSSATEFTSRMCPVGSTILIDQDDKQNYDKYGRLLANVYCGEKSLNSALLYNDHANILTQYCSTSEFSSKRWAQDFGCGVKSSTLQTQTSSSCDLSYPDFCIASPPPDLDCGDISQKRFTVLQPDPHRFDGDDDGIGCES